MNTVEVDDARLGAELDDVLSDAPPDPAPAASEPDAPASAGDDLTMEQIEAAAARYDFGALMLVSRGFDLLAPAWDVTDDEKAKLAHSVALCAAAWFPDAAIPARYVVLLMLGGTAYQVVEARRDPSTGKIRERVKRDARTIQAPASAGTGAGEGAGGAGFSTSA